MSVTILPADLDSDEFAALISAHTREMLTYSPPESSHALTVDGLRATGIDVWAMYLHDQLAGCGALGQIEAGHGEIKSMHTLRAFRGQGCARRMLDHIIRQARCRGYARLSLETGSMKEFIPALKLYEARGFVFCPPFKGYDEDINSVFMTLVL